MLVLILHNKAQCYIRCCNTCLSLPLPTAYAYHYYRCLLKCNTRAALHVVCTALHCSAIDFSKTKLTTGECLKPVLKCFLGIVQLMRQFKSCCGHIIISSIFQLRSLKTNCANGVFLKSLTLF